MLGERTCAGRACEYARKIEHTDPRKWAITLGERLGPRLSDFDDLQERQSGYCGGLRVLRPLLAGSSHATRSLGGDNCLFEFKPVPFRLSASTQTLARVENGRYWAIKPPSITSSVPVMKDASSDARNNTP
jgi:hypothetical protein